MVTVSPHQHIHITSTRSCQLILTLCTPPLHILEDVSELAVQVNIISVDKAVLLLHFPKLVYMLHFNSLVAMNVIFFNYYVTGSFRNLS